MNTRAIQRQISSRPGPAVSVVIPVYNHSETLALCLESLALQEPVEGGFEAIVVDDGSLDSPEKVVQRFAFARLVVQRNAGPAAARNRGARTARGAILAFIDADCAATPSWLRELIRPFADPRIAGVQGRYATEQRALVARFAQLEIEQRYDRLARRDTIDMVGTYSAAFRRNVFMSFGGFDDSMRMAEDMEFSFRLHEAGHRLVFAPNAVVSHRHPATLPEYLKQKFGHAYWRYGLYQERPGKIVSDSYTPQGLKLQVAVVASLVLALASLPFWSAGSYAAGVSACFFNLIVLPFSIQLFRKDRAVGLLAPWLLLGRAASLLSGLAVACAVIRHSKTNDRAAGPTPKVSRKVARAMPALVAGTSAHIAP